MSPIVPEASHCELAEQETRLQEELAEADAVLGDDAWRWVRELADAMRDGAAQSQSKRFFLRLLRAQDSAAMDAVLGDMERWRDALEGSVDKHSAYGQEERKGVQALFLLGLDKQMSLARCP